MKHFDTGSIIVIIVTFVLFALALFFSGFTHDILLEAGVFLVSVKLITMSYKASVTETKILDALDEIRNLLKDMHEKK